MNSKVKGAFKGAKDYSIWVISAIAIIVMLKVALSPEPFEFFIFLKRLVVVIATIVPSVYLLLFLGFYFELINKNNNSE